MNTLETFKRDNLLVDFIKQHRGKGEVVGSKEIANYLENKGYKSNIRCINNLVKRVMYERNLPICSINSKGYFWATSQEELCECINELAGRILEMHRRIEHLKSFMPNK